MGGGTHLLPWEGVGGPNSDEETESLVIYVNVLESVMVLNCALLIIIQTAILMPICIVRNGE